MHDGPKVTFRLPPEFTPPEGIQPGDTFDVVCTLKPEGPRGEVCIVMVGDTPMPGYKEGKEKYDEGKPDYGEYARGMPKPGMDQQPPGQQGAY